MGEGDTGNASPADAGSAVYRSYLLRLWRDDAAGAPWRAMLESVTAHGERYHFPSLHCMFAFLEDACESPANDAPDTS